MAEKRISENFPRIPRRQNALGVIVVLYVIVLSEQCSNQTMQTVVGQLMLLWTAVCSVLRSQSGLGIVGEYICTGQLSLLPLAGTAPSRFGVEM